MSSYSWKGVTKAGQGRGNGNYENNSCNDFISVLTYFTSLLSNITSLGRFVLTPEIYDYISKTKPVKNGEVYLPTAIDMLAKDTNVYAYVFDGCRYDMGSKFGFLKANIEVALRDPILREQLVNFIKGK